MGYPCGRDGVIVIFLATLTSFTLGLVLSFRFDEFKGPRLSDRELGAVSRESAMGALREAAHLRDAVYCTSEVGIQIARLFILIFWNLFRFPILATLHSSVETLSVAGVHPVDRRLLGPAPPRRHPHRDAARQAAAEVRPIAQVQRS